jgi:CopG family transcriptional regulator / antitoxin EndoAI
MRTAKVVSISLPPDMEKEVQELAKEEHRTISELFREAMRQYTTRKLLQSARKQGRAQAKKKGIKPSDVLRIIKEDRRVHSAKR